MINIILADDHQLVREALRSLIEAHADMKVVAEAQNGLEAVELVSSLQPDIVIMDINMPEMNGLAATRAITRDNKNLNVIGLSLNDQNWSEETIIKAGASAYISKDEAGKTLCMIIRREYEKLEASK